MDKKEIKQLEKEREKLEEARERLEEERERMEEEREEVEQEMRGEKKQRIIINNHELTDEQQEKLDKAQDKMDKAQMNIDMALDGLDEKIENSIAGIDFDKINATVEKAMASVDKHCHNIDIDVRSMTKNVGVLNFKDITEEEIEKMGPIKNVGVIIVPEELMSKVSSKIVKNIGTVVPYKKGWRIYSGHTEISQAMLEALDGDLEFLQIGHLVIDPDVEPEMLKKKIKAFHNYGHVQATEKTYGVLMAKCLENYGQISKNGHDED